MENRILKLHNKAIALAKIFHETEFELIEIIGEIDKYKAYLHVSYNSLFEYAVKALKLSEANAYNFITVARKSESVPELKIAIKEGGLSVAKARKIRTSYCENNTANFNSR